MSHSQCQSSFLVGRKPSSPVNKTTMMKNQSPSQQGGKLQVRHLYMICTKVIDDRCGFVLVCLREGGRESTLPIRRKVGRLLTSKQLKQQPQSQGLFIVMISSSPVPSLTTRFIDLLFLGQQLGFSVHTETRY